MFKRLLPRPDRTFFLFGPRGTGKSTWLREVLPEAHRLDLLDTSLYLELSREPHRLRALVGDVGEGGWVLLDEVQKIPALLDEVHLLLGDRNLKFALCGSSARKLKRGGAILLAGRASTYSMEALSAVEVGERFDLERALDWGLLPFVVNEPAAAVDILEAYVHTYLKEELQAEGIIRHTPPFLRFLAVAGQLNGQTLNAQNVAREAAVPRATVDTYVAVLVDTLVAHVLPAWRPGLKVREAAHPKLYWFDPGVARAAAGQLRDPSDRPWQGTALETLLFHELRVYNEVSRKHRPISYYRTAAGVEVDFVIETALGRPGRPPHVVALEVKRAERWDSSFERPLRALAATSGAVVDRMIGVYCGDRTYRFGDLQVLPVQHFIEALFAGEVF